MLRLLALVVSVLGGVFLGGCAMGPAQQGPPVDLSVPTEVAEAFDPGSCMIFSYREGQAAIRCEGLWVSPHYLPASAKEGLELGRNLLRAGGVEVEELRLETREGPTKALAFEVRWGEVVLTSHIHAYVPWDGGSMLFECYALGRRVEPEQCAGFVDAMVADTFEGAAVASPGGAPLRVRLLDQTFDLEGPCGVMGPSSFQCNRGQVSWELFESEALATEAFEASLEGESPGRSKACAVLGQSAVCYKKSVGNPLFGRRLLVYRAVIEHEGMGLALTCSHWTHSVRRTPGPICEQFIELW